MFTRFQRIGIVGLGSIGASLAELIKTKLPDTEIYGLVQTQQTIDIALKRRIINFGFTFLESFPLDLDLIFLCSPINTIKSYAEYFLANCQSDVIITDTASVKRAIYPEIMTYTDKEFIGGHPMGGIEKGGIQHAKAELISNFPYILIKEDSHYYEELRNFLVSLDIKIIELASAEEHDFLLNYASHIPYLMAVLTTSLAEKEIKNTEIFKTIIATGFYDTTRRASAETIWGKDVFAYNKENLLQGIKLAKKELDNIATLILNEDYIKLEEFFQKIKIFRDKLYE